MGKIAVSDLRRGMSVLSDDFGSPPISVPMAAALELPYGLACLPDGRLLTADRGQSRIVAVAQDGSNWQSFGEPGDGVGQFRQPMSVAVSREGRILVADTGNCRVVAMDSMAGEGWQTYGRQASIEDSGPGTFARPVCIRQAPGGLLIADAGAARIVRLSHLSDAFWDVSPQGTFANPVAVDVLSNDTIVVGDLAREGLFLLNSPSDGVANVIADPLLRYPSALAVGVADDILVCCLPTLALCSLARAGAAWDVSLAVWLDGLGLRRPTGLCRLT